MLYLLSAFLVFLPFQPFLVTWTEWPAFAVLKDIFVVALVVLALFHRIKTRQLFIQDKIEWIITLLFIWTIFSYLFIGCNSLGLIYSWRYSLEIWLVFWAVRSFTFSEKQHDQIINIFLTILVIIFVSGVFLALFLPKDFLLRFGYSTEVAVGNGIWIPSNKLPAVQILPGGIARAQSTLSGPIQLATYLLVLLGVPLSLIRQKKLAPFSQITLVALIFLLGLTFTRSAWISALVALVIFAADQLKITSQTIWKLSVGIVLIVTIFVSLYWFSPIFKEKIDPIIVRRNSSAEHKQSLVKIWQKRNEIGFWGRGVGLSGPASFRANPASPLAVEDSYLRFYEELGIFGIWLFIWLIFVLLSKLKIKNKKESNFFQPAAYFSLISISVTAILADSFTESIPMLTLGVILGLALPSNLKNKQPTTERIEILGVPIDRIDREQLLNIIKDTVSQSKKINIFTVNAEFFVEAQKNPEFTKALLRSDILTVDGSALKVAAEIFGWRPKSQSKITNYFLQPIRLIYLILSGLSGGLRLILAPGSFERLPEKVTGSDLSLELCRISGQEKWKIFFLGSSVDQKVVKKNLQLAFPDLLIAGVEYGGQISPAGIPANPKIIQRVNQSKADILLVGFGTPKQELFITQYKDKINIPVLIGVGAAIDFLTGKQKRAPLIWQKLSLEWLFRLLTNLSDHKRRKRIYQATIVFPLLVCRRYLSLN